MASAEARPPIGAVAICVEVVFCAGPGLVDCTSLRLPPGTTVVDALRASRVLERHPTLGPAPPVGVWGRMESLGHPLRDRDRVEVYRPLTVDPKEARRLRYRRDKPRRSKPISGIPS